MKHASRICGAAACLIALTGPAAADDVPVEACGVLGPLATGAECSGSLTGGSEPDEAGCPTVFDPSAGLQFADDLHRRWYQRFWTGRCEGFGLFDMCVEDGTSWPTTVEKMTANLPPQDLARGRAEWNAVGRMIGFEWARRNNVRRISTSDLQSWSSLAELESDPWKALRVLCDKAQSQLEGG